MAPGGRIKQLLGAVVWNWNKKRSFLTKSHKKKIINQKIANLTENKFLDHQTSSEQKQSRKRDEEPYKGNRAYLKDQASDDGAWGEEIWPPRKPSFRNFPERPILPLESERCCSHDRNSAGSERNWRTTSPTESSGKGA
ncbi:asparagine--tRNA ligase [Striga asiatica]|uniref:Asparagine--tRNA ligase n=1 Tax=Striga asiatica TaxID=4170 RepID=A0A5A7P413_STRAF|nr:asparagine--tRNA ligase [Striga asiatica]